MVHFYDLCKRVPRARRKVLAKFIHRLKCLCGRKYHVHVNVDEPDGLVSIETAKLSIDAEVMFSKELVALCDEHRIPRRNIRYDVRPIYDIKMGYVINIYTDFCSI